MSDATTARASLESWMSTQSLSLLEQLATVSLCQIADACGASVMLDTALQPLDRSFRVCGPAYTVVCPADDNLTLHHALHLASPGQILVVSGSGGNKAALWGELMSISAQARGLKGTIIDGPARDPQEIAALKYPVFARSIRARRASKERYGSIGQRISLSTITVQNGDIVVADCHGLAVFPQEMLPGVVEQSLAIARKERELKQILRGGQTLFEFAHMSSLIPPPGTGGDA
jgi:4-hydroxy-4-methyl-2-oxoglutarate aldolase